MRQHIVERGVQHQPFESMLARLFGDGVEQPAADSAAARVFSGYQVIDLDKATIDQVFREARAGERDRHAIAPCAQGVSADTRSER